MRAIFSTLFLHCISAVVATSTPVDNHVYIATVIMAAILILLILYIFYPALCQSLLVGPYSSTSSTPLVPKIQPLLSIVIPAYNEEKRLDQMLQATFDYLSSTQKDGRLCLGLDMLQQASDETPSPFIQWLLVNDGSSDGTSRVFNQFAERHGNNDNRLVKHEFVLVEYKRNAGKGAAVQIGMLTAAARWVLMVDADGATEFASGFESLAVNCMGSNNSVDVFIASRAALPQEARSLPRQIATKGFGFLTRRVILGNALGDIKDTQCGFKLFKRRSRDGTDNIRALFEHLHLRRWAFDIEVLFRAKQHLGLSIKEVYIPKWTEVEGSKLSESTYTLIMAASGMLRDMLCLRLCYGLNIWPAATPIELVDSMNETKKQK